MVLCIVVIRWCFGTIQEKVDLGSLEEDGSGRKSQEAKSRTESTEELEEVKGDWFCYCLRELFLSSLYNEVHYSIHNFTHSEKSWFIDQDVIRLVKEKLKSMPCQNQGFVLDGFPETIQQAKDLFSSNGQFLMNSTYIITHFPLNTYSNNTCN